MERSVIGTLTEERYLKGSVLMSSRNVELKKVKKNVPRVRDAVDHFVAIKNITKVTVNYLV